MTSYKFKIVYSIADEPYLSEEDSGLRSREITIKAENPGEAWDFLAEEDLDGISAELISSRVISWNFYDNSDACGECSGNGCRYCIGGLSGTGRARFPLALAVNNCKPPQITNPYAWKFHPRSAAHLLLNRR